MATAQHDTARAMGNGQEMLINALRNCLDIATPTRRAAEQFIAEAESQKGYGVELAKIALGNTNSTRVETNDVGIRQIRCIAHTYSFMFYFCLLQFNSILLSILLENDLWQKRARKHASTHAHKIYICMNFGFQKQIFLNESLIILLSLLS